jgi:ribosomal protein S16
MILIRLKRRSSKNNLSYAIVVTSNKASPNGSQFIENIGHYNPIVDSWSNKYLYIDLDRFKFWVEQGARVNLSLFVLLRGLLSFKFAASWSQETSNGSVYTYASDIEKKEKKLD